MSLNNRGFTLIEIMITLVVSMFVGGAATMLYRTQVSTYVKQEAIGFAQQGSRACRLIMSDDLRLAGYNNPNSGAAFTAIALNGANPNSLTLNYWDDAAAVQHIVTYSLGFAYAGADDGVLDLLRADNNGVWGGGPFPVYESIINLEFMYTVENPSGVDSIMTTVPNSRLADIKSITVSMLSQAYRQTDDTVDLNTYQTPFGTTWGPFNDAFKRRLNSFTVALRNN